VSGGVESDVPEAQDMGPLPPYTGDQPDETTLSTSKKLVLLVVALVVFHLIAVVYGITRLYRNSGTAANSRVAKVRKS
jgi:hypothetical protein